MDKWLNKYDLQARVAPAILVFLPVILGVYILFPSLWNIAKAVLGVVVLGALGILLANIIRNVGKKKEQELYRKWDGMPTTRLLRHRDKEIDPVTKERYYRFLEINVQNLKIPTESEELQDKDKADIQYTSAVNWLRQKNRNNDLLLSMNISYGFARNFWAMKLWGVIICLLDLIGSLSVLYLRYGLVFKNVPIEVWFSIAITLSFMFIWVFIVTPKWVHMKAIAYAKMLLETCDSN